MSFLKMYFISSKANIELFDISSNHKFNLVLHLLTILLLKQKELFSALLPTS